MRFPLFLAAAALTTASLSVSAQTLKPGLWEISNKMGGNAEMDQAMAEMQKQLAAMPPAERKQMEAMMAQRGMQMPKAAAGGGMAMRICMTREMVERNEMPMEKSDCKITSQSKSGNTMKMAFSCPNPPSTGETQFTLAGPEAYTSKVTVKTSVNGKNETVTMDGGGKWLAADCGAVKPMGAPPKK
jgi:hypothetical protein